MSLLKETVLRDIAKAVESETKGCGRDKHRLACVVADQVTTRRKRPRSRSRSPRTKPPTVIKPTKKSRASKKKPAA